MRAVLPGRALAGILPAVLFAMVPAGSARATDPDVIDVGERTPLSLVLVTPTGAPARNRSSDVIRTIDEVVRAKTALALESTDDSLAQGCRGRLLCMVLRLRPDYERDGLRDGNSVRPYSDHLRALKERGVEYPKLLLLVTNVTREGEPDRMSAQLIDTDRVLADYHVAPRDDEYWEANVEAAINESAPASPRTEVPDLEAMRRFVAALFEEHLRPTLQAIERWEPYGDIVIEGVPAGLSILLDDSSVGVTNARATRLTGVLPGPRTLRLESPELVPHREVLTVVRGESTRTAPRLSTRPSGYTRTTHVVLEVAGAAAVVSGGILMAMAASTSDGDYKTYCVSSLLPGCTASSAFVTSGYDPQAGAQPNGEGVALAPLGLGLVVGGLAWGAGTWLFVDDGDTPWLPFVVGLVAGGATFAITSAVGSGGFEDQ